MLTADQEEKTLVVLGGDGTVNEVLNGIQNFDHVILGYIPTGFSNDLQRGMGRFRRSRQSTLSCSASAGNSEDGYCVVDYGERADGLQSVWESDLMRSFVIRQVFQS